MIFPTAFNTIPDALSGPGLLPSLPLELKERTLIRLPGAVCDRDPGPHFKWAHDIARQLIVASRTSQIFVVIGAGRLGGKHALELTAGFDRRCSSRMGRLGTASNAEVLTQCLKQQGAQVVIQRLTIIPEDAEDYSMVKADQRLNDGAIVIFGGGEQYPDPEKPGKKLDYTTDMVALRRANELDVRRLIIAREDRTTDGPTEAYRRRRSRRSQSLPEHLSFAQARTASRYEFHEETLNRAAELRRPVRVVMLDRYDLNDPKPGRNVEAAAQGAAIGTLIS
ncbi:MAG TPA: hypothetical protein VLI05_07030 [Candidatus Saccharimonadia bacterium]|nr:hypothetical protein [Candidatus Saccharimonadia bacterium]